MLTLITDQIGDEPDILSGYEQAVLAIKDLEGRELARFQAPQDHGWSHERLCECVLKLPESLWIDGADAYLCDQWIGGTEV